MLMDCNGNALSLSLCDKSKTTRAEKRTRVRKLTMHWRQGEKQQKARTLTLARFSFICVCVFPAHIGDLKTVEMGKGIYGRNKSSSLRCCGLATNHRDGECGTSKLWYAGTAALVSLIHFFVVVPQQRNSDSFIPSSVVSPIGVVGREVVLPVTPCGEDVTFAETSTTSTFDANQVDLVGRIGPVVTILVNDT